MSGLYIHIPFCKKRCFYCDFFSTTESKFIPRYVDALCNELRLRYREVKSPLKTIYFGGGTPSQLPPESLKKIFDSIELYFDIHSCVEITLEANPDDLSPEYMDGIKKLPINRISMGVQSFDDNDLTALNRRHSSQQATDAVRLCREAGIENISIDLIYGLPEQTITGWKENIRRAISLAVPHISAYHLIYEEGTPLTRMLELGKVKECDEELSLTFFETLISTLAEEGYEHYEISNFARPGMYARHNTSYWQNEEYLGLGAAAHSFDTTCRKCNVAHLMTYMQKIECNETAYETEILDTRTLYNETIITALRTMWGLDMTEVNARFGNEKSEYCMRMAQRHIQEGRLSLTGNRLRLTRSGIFISDSILSDLLYLD